MFENKTLSFLENLHSFGWKLNLENIRNLMDFLGNPHTKLNCIHVAGTNGKGSTSAVLESVLRTAGYKTGLYTSPHLVEVNERIRVNGVNISDIDLSRYITSIEKEVTARKCTYFETLTAIAFQYFYDCNVDIAIFEVGLGGRFDATNIIDPILSIITEVDFDHEQHLGSNIASIAGEKAGIIKTGKPCLFQTEKQEAIDVFENVARKQNAELLNFNKICRFHHLYTGLSHSEFNLQIFETELVNLRLNIPSRVQVKNAALAICAIRVMQTYGFMVSDAAVADGLRNLSWQGRLQIIQESPTILVDVAHNVASIGNLIEHINSCFAGKKTIFVLGLLADKNITEIIKLIAPNAEFVFAATPNSNRALPAKDLVLELNKKSVPAQIFTNFSQVLDLAKPDDLICVTGSHYLVGDFLKLYKKLDK